MQVAIGLPALIPGVDGETVLEWARRAERSGFHSVVVDERLVWSGYEILITASAAAAVTSSIGILAAVVVAPLRANPAEFAKQVASIDALSGGRLTLGLGVGSRRDDFEASGIDFHRRGRITDELLERATALWRGELADFGPPAARRGGPRLVFGGRSPATFRRLATYGSGWVCATSGGPEGLRSGAALAAEAFAAVGRTDVARLYALTPRFALGPKGREAVEGYVRAYNAYRGPEAEQRAASALLHPDDVAAQLAAFEAAGCDELVINPADPDPDEVDRLADAIGARFLDQR